MGRPRWCCCSLFFPAAPQIPRFQSELLRAIGYAPNLDECVACHRPVRRGSPAYFSAAAGGLLCRDCEPAHVEKRRVPATLVGTTPATGDFAEISLPPWVDVTCMKAPVLFVCRNNGVALSTPLAKQTAS